MPSKTKAQHNFMAMVANNPKAAKRVGVPQKVGEDFMAADKGRKFAKGGDMATKKLFKGKETYGEELKEARAIKSGKITPEQYARGEKMEEAKKGMKRGGYVRSADGVAKKGKTAAKQVVMKKGGRCG